MEHVSSTIKNASQEASAVRVVLSLMSATIEAVDEAGDMGCPGGILYAGLQSTAGISIDMFTGMMNAMVESGHLVKAGELYTATTKGRQFASANSHLFKS